MKTIPYRESDYIMGIELYNGMKIWGYFYHQHVDENTIPSDWKVFDIRCKRLTRTIPAYIVNRVDDPVNFYGCIVVVRPEFTVNTFITIKFWKFELRDRMKKPIDVSSLKEVKD